jgi:hypothetical protein
MTLKRITAIFFSAMLLCAVNVTNVCGQTKVTGHITAEVIESVHTSSKAVTGFAIKNELSVADSPQKDVAYNNSEILNLGTISINAGASMAYDIKLNEAILSDDNGNCFTIEPKIASGISDTLRTDGSQTLSLNGTARLTHGLASGRYEGSYMLNVVYN